MNVYLLKALCEKYSDEEILDNFNKQLSIVFDGLNKEDYVYSCYFKDDYKILIISIDNKCLDGHTMYNLYNNISGMINEKNPVIQIFNDKLLLKFNLMNGDWKFLVTSFKDLVPTDRGEFRLLVDKARVYEYLDDEEVMKDLDNEFASILD